MRRGKVGVPWFACAVVALGSSSLGAQDPVRPPTPQARPAVALQPGPADAEYRSWLETPGAAALVPQPLLVQTGRFEVLVMSAAARRTTQQADALAGILTACGDRLRLAADDSAAITAIDPWQPFEEEALRVPLVALSVIPSQAGASECGADEAAKRAALARGLRVGEPPTYSPLNDVQAVELQVDGEAVTPVMIGSAPVTQLSRSGIGGDGTRQVRMYVQPDVLAPDGRGRPRRVELVVWMPGRETPERMRMDPRVIETVWADAMRWRAVRAGNAEAEAGIARLAAAELRPEERRRLGIRLVEQYAEREDGAIAQWAAARVLDRDPCLTLASSAEARTVRVLEAARRPARCTSRPLYQVAAASLVPGLGQMASGRRTAFALAAATGVSLVFQQANARLTEARDRYAAYQADPGVYRSDMPTETTEGSMHVQRMFARAEEARIASNRLMIMGIGTWALVGIEALVSEALHARNLRRVSGYDPAARTALQVLPTPAGMRVGLSVGFR
jgi:hypothetical protein